MSDQSKALAIKEFSAPIAPGSQPVRKGSNERYCQYRARGYSKPDAWRNAMQRRRGGYNPHYTEKQAYWSAWNLERKIEIVKRIQYLSKDEQAITQAIRATIAERLLSIHEADIGDAFEITPNGNEKLKRLHDMSPDFRKNIEKVTPDSKGNWIPQLYSKTAVSKELRALYAIGRPSEASEVSRLSDAELIQQLSDQAKELGVDIKLDYTFAQQPSASDTEGHDSQVIDNIDDDKPKR